MNTKSFLKIDHPFDENTLEELKHMRQLRLDYYEGMAGDLGATINVLAQQGIPANPFVLKQEIDEKISELKRRIVEHDESIYLDEIELYISSLS